MAVLLKILSSYANNKLEDLVNDDTLYAAAAGPLCNFLVVRNDCGKSFVYIWKAQKERLMMFPIREYVPGNLVKGNFFFSDAILNLKLDIKFPTPSVLSRVGGASLRYKPYHL